MIYVVLILVLLVALVVYVVRKQNKRAPEVEPTVVDGDCCGAHEVCEKDSLLSSPVDVVYFDDEELDVLAFRSCDTFSEEEVELLEGVFYSLRDSDVAAWIRSLQMRGIDLPDYLKEEAILIISERREHTAALYNASH